MVCQLVALSCCDKWKQRKEKNRKAMEKMVRGFMRLMASTHFPLNMLVFLCVATKVFMQIDHQLASYFVGTTRDLNNRVQWLCRTIVKSNGTWLGVGSSDECHDQDIMGARRIHCTKRFYPAMQKRWINSWGIWMPIFHPSRRSECKAAAGPKLALAAAASEFRP